MKKTNYLLITLLGFALLLPTVSMAELKIGIVNAARLLEEAPQARAETELLNKEFSGRQNDLAAIQKELENLQGKLARDGAIMSEGERKKVGLDVLSRQRDLRRKQDDMRQDFTMRRNDVIGSLQAVIGDVIRNMGDAGGYDIIFFEAIAYSNPKLDITDEVLKELQKKVTAK